MLKQAPMPNPSSEPRTPLHLRDARPDDALCLSVLAMQVFLDTYATQGIRTAIAREVLSTYSQASFDAALADSKTHITVAEHDGHLIGFAQLSFSSGHPLAPAGEQAELLRLYVQEPFTRAKVGSQLLMQAQRISADAGATVLWLTPWVHNHRALAFYQKHAFVDHGLTHFVFEGESHENRVLAKSLQPPKVTTSPPRRER